MSGVDATVNIDAVIPQAQRIPAHAVVVGDAAFDTFGNPRRITAIKLQRVRGTFPMLWIQTQARPHFWEPWCFLDEEVTVTPSLRAREES